VDGEIFFEISGPREAQLLPWAQQKRRVKLWSRTRPTRGWESLGWRPTVEGSAGVSQTYSAPGWCQFKHESNPAGTAKLARFHDNFSDRAEPADG